MAKRIILYNLADNVTDAEFKDYVTKEKGALISSLPAVKKYELVKITGAMAGKSPYNYGVWDLNCNQLIPMGYPDKSGFGGGPISGMLVRVYKA